MDEDRWVFQLMARATAHDGVTHCSPSGTVLTRSRLGVIRGGAPSYALGSAEYLILNAELGVARLRRCCPMERKSDMPTQQYRQYIDQESAVVKRPEGPGWSDPFGDGVWRSSWFYSSLLVIKGKDASAFQHICDQHGVTESLIGRFLTYFRENCTGPDEWTLPKNPSQRFSGDQLAPLLYFLTTVNAWGDEEARGATEAILKKLIDIDRHHGALSDTHQGQIRDNQRYAIDIACRMYDIKYLRGVRRDICKFAFSTALALNNQLAQLPWPSLATQDAYSVFNSLGLVSEACVKWGKDDEDVDTWRKNYRVHADKGWGPAFRITSGRSYSANDIETYASAYITRDQDNDIIMAQRPAKYLNGEFGPDITPGPNKWLVLDYIVLKGLELLWQPE
jgi:hypothetical protein